MNEETRAAKLHKELEEDFKKELRRILLEIFPETTEGVLDYAIDKIHLLHDMYDVALLSQLANFVKDEINENE